MLSIPALAPVLLDGTFSLAGHRFAVSGNASHKTLSNHALHKVTQLRRVDRLPVRGLDPALQRVGVQ